MSYSYLISTNYELCRGCRLCELVCSFSHHEEFNPARSRIRAIRTETDGIVTNVPAGCQQCEEAVCMAVCPVNAISRDPDTGAKLVDGDKCLGCRRCAYTCPFGGIMVDHVEKIASKCDLCMGEPECVQICPFDALEYIRSDKLDMKQKRKGIAVVVKSLKDKAAQQ
ncbi:MAG: 4Fe-4S dicluster domain-containing protein [Deltaproteobacteria bacterium]|nr:4Fe-4S dicluster domain-containing protein [Deltaproteobacteria bacterium]